jgi:type IX secretion system PorP/SprF family membrane protein
MCNKKNSDMICEIGNMQKLVRVSCLYIVAYMLGSFYVAGQQEQMYSQYMFNMLHINPAYAGNRGATDNVTLLYRNQWAGFKGAPKTCTLSWDRRQSESNIGYGLDVYNDKLGIETSNGMQAFFSYYVPFENAFLSLGLSGGVVNYRAAYTESEIVDSTDPQFQSDVKGWLPTAGFGVLFATDSWYVGFSIPALLHTKINVSNYLNQNSFGASNHCFLTGGYIFECNNFLKIKPSAMIKAVKGTSIQYDINANVWYRDYIGLGISYRIKDALVAMLEMQVLKQLRIGYSYDYTLTNLRVYSKGTHEIMLRYELPIGDKKSLNQEGEENAHQYRYY